MIFPEKIILGIKRNNEINSVIQLKTFKTGNMPESKSTS